MNPPSAASLPESARLGAAPFEPARALGAGALAPGMEPVTPVNSDRAWELFRRSRTNELVLGGIPPEMAAGLVAIEWKSGHETWQVEFPGFEERLVFVADRLVGWVALLCDPEQLFVIELAIDPDVQGKGIGGALIRALQLESGPRPMRSSALRWHRALDLYRRLGFRTISETDTHFRFEWRRFPAPSVLDDTGGR